MFQLQFGVKYTFDYLDVTHLKILIILKTWHKDSDFTLFIGNFATIFKCIYAKKEIHNLQKGCKERIFRLFTQAPLCSTFRRALR